MVIPGYVFIMQNWFLKSRYNHIFIELDTRNIYLYNYLELMTVFTDLQPPPGIHLASAVDFRNMALEDHNTDM